MGRRLLRQFSLRTQVDGFGSSPISYRFANNEGRSDYRALQIQFQRRLSRGIQGLVSYTLGSSHDNVSDDINFGNSPDFFNSLGNNYAASDFDVRHSLSGAITADLPHLPASRALTLMTEGGASTAY